MGARRRAGVLFPLFSLHSRESLGVGEFADLPLLADWCRQTGLSLIQLLPLNDVGGDFRPYDACSSFALEPMHLRLESLAGVDPKPFMQDLARLHRQFSLSGLKRFDLGVKPAKISQLRVMFAARRTDDPVFERFKEREAGWLEDYALYKVLKERFEGASWEQWPAPYRDRDAQSLARLRKEAADRLEFEKWLQWQAALQMESARRSANAKGVLLVGDLPFLVSRDSADVWAAKHLFRLDKSSGAPPDLYFADGQAWGMPPHDWAGQAREGYAYWRAKIAYAARFYDAFRIDHFVGLFRLWTFDRAADGQAVRETGAFDPPDPKTWEEHGRRILDAFVGASTLLPCAEDLGVVPDCSAPVLREYGIPGMEIQRWMRRWKTDGEWIAPSQYRANAIATLSTHDMTPLELWWKTEAVTAEERQKFLSFLGLPADAPASHDWVRRALHACLSSQAIFSIQLFQDWFSLAEPGSLSEDDRINLPGYVLSENWRLLSRYSLEDMTALSVNSTIKSLVADTNRLV